MKYLLILAFVPAALSALYSDSTAEQAYNVAALERARIRIERAELEDAILSGRITRTPTPTQVPTEVVPAAEGLTDTAQVGLEGTPTQTLTPSPSATPTPTPTEG